MHRGCSIFHQEISSVFLKLGRIDFPFSHLSEVFHGGDGAGGCRSCPGPTARQQWSQGWTKCPQDLAQDRTHLEWLLLATGLIRVTHMSPCDSSTVPPESQSFICCLSFPSCAVDEVMPEGRVFIFSPTNTKTLQEGKGSCQSPPHPSHPCCHHTPNCTSSSLGRADPFSSPLQAPPLSLSCCHSQVRFFS